VKEYGNEMGNIQILIHKLITGASMSV